MCISGLQILSVVSHDIKYLQISVNPIKTCNFTEHSFCVANIITAFANIDCDCPLECEGGEFRKQSICLGLDLLQFRFENPNFLGFDPNFRLPKQIFRAIYTIKYAICSIGAKFKKSLSPKTQLKRDRHVFNFSIPS